MTSKEYYKNALKKVDKKLKSCKNNLLIKEIYFKNVKPLVEKKLNSFNENDNLKYEYFPPLFLFLKNNNLRVIKSFEKDINLVINKHSSDLKQTLLNILKAKEKQDREWAGNLFEIYIKSELLKYKSKSKVIQLDPKLSNGLHSDIKANLWGKEFNIECTIISDSDEDRRIWNSYVKDKSLNENMILTRPGKYDRESDKSPDPHYDTIRFYCKVYNKVAKYLNLEKGQMNAGIPNLLFISFYCPYSPLPEIFEGISWGLDELFCDQPKGLHINSEENELDISLTGWMDFYAKELINKEKLNKNYYLQNMNELLWAIRKIGAIFIFNKYKLFHVRKNYYSQIENTLSHKDIGKFEQIFKDLPIWAEE